MKVRVIVGLLVLFVIGTSCSNKTYCRKAKVEKRKMLHIN